jgi:uncharacterized membrane protein YidH (DUF202 family)
VTSPAAYADPGLASERTALSWRRTALSTAVLGLLLVRVGAPHGRPSHVLLGAGALLLAAAMGRLGSRSTLRSPAQRRAEVRTVAVALTGVCLGALALIQN